MKKLTFLIIIVFISSFSFSQKAPPPDDSMPQVPGKCYAKCLIQNKYEIRYQTLILYNGQNLNQDGIEEIRIIENPATIRWVKKKADRKCLSSNPEDCMVWCLMEAPEIVTNYYIVNDTTYIKDFDIKEIESKILLEPGGYTEWREIVCESDLTPSLIYEIKESLLDHGYEIYSNDTTEMTAHLKSVLNKFQEENELPIGQIDWKTLDRLGVYR